MPTEFDSAIRQMQEQDLKSSMYVGARSNPDEEADLQSIADRVGLPVEAVRRNKPEVELHDKLKSFDYEKVIKESPALSAWYADRKNAAVAHDDFDTLSETGKILKAVPTGLKQGWEKQRMMFLNYQEAIGNISPSERSELSELDKRSKSSAGVLAEGVPSYLKAGADVLGMLGRSGIRAIEQGGVPGMVIGASAGGMLGMAGGPGAPATVPAGAAAGGVLGLKIGTTAQFAVNTYESSVGEVYGDLKGYKDAKTGATIDPTVARYAALIAGAPVAGLEFLSLGKAIKAVPGGEKLVGWMTTEKLKQVLVKPTVQQALKDISTRYAVAVGTETFTEGLQKVVSVLAREAAQEADGRKFSAYDQEQFKADVAETGAEMHEAFKASVTLGGAAAGGSAIIERNKIDQAKQNQHFFEALGEKAGESNLRGRLPGRYQEVITKLAEDGPVQNVMIPSEKFTEYFQSVGIDPATAAQEAGASNYAEALAVGGDVVIPISGFAATIAPTEHLQGLQQDMRLSAEEMTMREAELAEKNRPETERELQNEIERLTSEGKASNALDTAIQRVITDVEGQLVGRYDLATARTMAASMRGMAVLATRANPDADPLTAARDLWEKYGLNIQANPLPDILTKRPDFDARIDPLLDRLRAGDVPSQSDVFGKSLVEVLRAGGGVSDSGGELAALDVEAWDKTARKGGQKRLVSKGGMSFDSAREYLKERGFDVGETEADVVAAIDREMRGDPVFAVGAGENETMKTADDLAQLDRVLAEMGVDLNAMDNAAVKAALRNEVGAGETAYNQGTSYEGDTIEIDGVSRPTTNSNGKRIAQTEEGLRNFWRWFGDSKAVDPEGKPLVVYHGTDADIEKFSREKLGLATGAKSAGLAFWLTDHPETATSYAHYAALDAPVKRALDAAEKLEQRAQRTGSESDWTAFDDKVAEAEQLDADIAGNTSRGQNVLPVYARLQNPLVIDAKGEGYTALEQGLNAILAKARRNKHDGVIIQNLDDAAGRVNMPATHVAVFNPDQIASSVGSTWQRGDVGDSILKQENLGSIQIGADRRMKINLFEKANLSTFLHETGHFYLEVLGDLSEAEGTNQQVKDDYAKILKFLGVSSRDQIRVEHHEKFARANEAYLMEGKAPAPELRDVFQKFSAWLKLIYETLRSLDVKLTEEVRGVMDRIYATDEEIKRAKEEAKFVELFIDAKAAKMSEAEFSAYKETVASMTVSAKEELQTKLMRIEKNKRESWWREGVAAIAKEVEAEFDAQPAAQALAKMGDKDSADRINKTQLIDRFGAEITKRLPKKGATAIYAEDGADIDAQAEMMGFESADDMVQALVNLPNRARYIAAESKARMMERHGDLLNSVALADEAMVALHNEEREKVLKIELRALNRRLRDVKPILDQKKAEEREKHRQALAATDVGAVSMYRDIARGQMGQKQVRDIAPNSYLVAGRKANRLAFEAMAKGDYAEAAIQKQREMFNHFMFIEGQKARKEADSIEKYLRGFNKTEARQKLGKAGGDYLAQIDGIMDRYEFRDVTLRKLDRRESLGAWLNKQEAEGATVEVPIELQDESRRLNWRQVPLDELRAVRDSVKNIAHLANLKNKLVRKGKLIEFDGVVKELLGAIESSGMASTGDLERPNLAGASLATKGAAKWRKFDAAHLKTEQIIEWLDGGRINGPWARYFFDLADSAQTKEYDLHAMVTSDIERISSEMPKEWRDSIYDQTRVRIPGFSAPVTRYTLLSIAFNMGNASNMQRLRDGYGLTDADFQAIRDELTETDMRFVQGVWDAIEKLWPEMSALQERTSGLPPEKVEAQPLEVAGKSYRGGYFPLVYDPRFSAAGAKQASEVESVQSFVASGYGRVGTNKGATISRVENLGLKPKLDYQHILSGHMAKVIKDISHRESVIGMQKILMQPDIKNGLIDKLGEDGYKELNRWLQTLVTDRADTLAQATGGAKLLMHLRTNTAIVTMGWKISTMLSQFAGFASALDLVKPQFMTKALIESAKNPRETWAMISEKSGEMRNRSNTIERDVRDALLRMRGDGGMLADVRRTAFFLTAYADRAVSVPTWLGAYNQAKAESLSEEDAIRAGDRAVRLSQGAGGSKDLSAVQRNNELMRLLTMYYTPFSVLYSRLRDVQHAAAIEGIGYVPKAVARLTALVILPAIMGDILAGRGPDDDEDETWWAIRKMLLYPMATIPFVRDLAGYLEAGIIKATGEGEMRFPPSYKLSPVMSAVDKMLKIPGKISDAVEGKKEWDGVLWDVFETSGYALGLPTAQPRITGEYFENVLRGENTDGMTFKDAIFRQQNKGATK